jgi:Leucine-rich repeat (LRR) protein
MRPRPFRPAALALATLLVLSTAAAAQDAKKPAAQDAKKPAAQEAKKAAAPAPPADDPAKLKATITALQKEVADLKLKLAAGELEKIGAYVTTDKPKEGGEVVTVSIMRLWNGDKDGLGKIKDLPNVQVVYVDNTQFNDAALAALKDLAKLNSLTVMSPQVTDAALESLKGLTDLNMLFLTSTKVGDAGLAKLIGLKNLKVLALSRTQVTDKGLDALKALKGLKSLYLIGTKVTDDGVKKLKQALPDVAVYK